MSAAADQPELDAEGHLLHLADWTPAIAEWLAGQEGHTLTPAHWEILNALRDFYATYQLSPSMRPFSKYLRQTLGEEQSRSIYLMQLFGSNPARTAARWAGLPKPDNCL